MNRRKFLRALGVGAVSAPVMVEVLSNADAVKKFTPPKTAWELAVAEIERRHALNIERALLFGVKP
jgi:hypothetical protein